MKLRSFCLSFSLGCGLAACGGAVAVIVPDEAGPTLSDGHTDGTTTRDAGQNDTASPKTCDELAKRLEQLREGAQKCCPFCNALQCEIFAEDVCCPISVENVDKGKELSLLAAEYRQSCQAVCPAILCRDRPSLDCDPLTSRCR